MAKKKSPSIERLTAAYIEWHKVQYPHFTDENRNIPAFKESSANELTKCIMMWLKVNGHQHERISVTGRYIQQKATTQPVIVQSEGCIFVVGEYTSAGEGKWIKPSMQVGSADISSTIKGKSVKIEVKYGKDKLSEVQKAYQKNIENSDGFYIVAYNFEVFLREYDRIIEIINKEIEILKKYL